MKQLVYIFLIACCSTAGAQSLDDYLVMAADSNAALKTKFLEYQAALEAVPQVGTLPDPELSFGYFISPIETRVGAQEARFGAMQMFPWFGTLEAKKDLKTEMAKAKFELFEQARNELYYKVKKAYYKLYELEEDIQIAEAHLKILQTFESLATTKFETGNASMVDVLRIQMEISELENTLLLFKDRRVPLTTAFNQHLNRESDINVVLPDTIEVIELLQNKENVAETIQGQNNQLQSLDFMQRATEYSMTVAKKMGAPSFSLGVNYIIVSERTDMMVPDNGQDAIMPMMSVKIPLYRGKYRAMIKEADLNLQALESSETAYRNALQTDLETAWVEYTDAGRRINLFRAQIKTAEQAQRILVEAYSNDGKDFEEILRIQRMLLKYELEIIKAVVDKNTAVAKINSLM